MALLIPWDKQETALLIDAYLRVKNGELSQNEAIKEVSSLLRHRAILSGMEIDEIFRNENGIRMQMSIIGYLIDDRSSGLHSASKMFNDMVSLYKNEPTSFYKILNQAKEECGIQVDVQEEFFVWLKEKIPSDRLSEFYIAYKNIESFCLNQHVLTQPLFETTNVVIIQSVIDTINLNRMFQFKYFRQLGKMRKAMNYYLTFIREASLYRNKELEKAPTHSGEAVLSVSEKENAPTKSDENPVGVVTTDKVGTTEDSNDDTLVWSFSNDNVDFSNIIPFAIAYFDEKETVRDWADSFVKIIHIMLEDYPSVISGMVGYYFADIRKVVLAGIAGANRFTKPVKLNNGPYVETDCAPDEIVFIVRALMDKCNMDYDNIEIYFKKSKVVNVATEQTIEESKIDSDSTVVNTSAAEGKVAFENWLIDGTGLTAQSAQSYACAVGVASQYSVQCGISNKELFFILDAEQVYQISTKLLENPSFARLNKEQNNRYRAALSRYWDYCKAVSSNTAVSIPTNASVPTNTRIQTNISVPTNTGIQTNAGVKANVNVPTKNINKQENEIKKSKIAFIEWAQSQQTQKTTILTYLMDINKCSKFAQQNNYIKEEHILLIQNADILERIFFEMRKDRNFIDLNNEKQNRLVFAMNKLISFRRAAVTSARRLPDIYALATPSVEPEQTSTVSTPTVSVNSQVYERYTAVLAENFVDGFRPTRTIDKNRFRMYYNDMFGEELTENDECLVRNLIKVGTLRDERIFVKDESEQKNLIEEINGTIMELFKGGVSCVYLDCLFTRFQEQLAKTLHIYNVDSLESVLFASGKRNYIKKYNYLFRYNKEPDHANDVIEYMKKSHLPITYSEFEKDLWYIPLDIVKRTLTTTPDIISVASGTYLYAPNLPISENEIHQIAELISHALLQHNYISDVELIQLIDENCPSVLMNTPDYPVWGLRNALAYLLRDRFSFKGAIISNKDEEISMAEVFSDFCRRSEHITVDELKEFASKLNTGIYWDSVYREMVRVSKNKFMRRDQIHFDIEQTDYVLDMLIQSTYAPIKTINLFLHFPPIDVPWNSFVLESYVANYSKKFRLLHVNYTATDCYGAIVRTDSGISDYRTLIVDVLVKNANWENEKDALQLLVDLGYQQKRSNSDIENVMQQAKARLQMYKK